MPLNGSTDAFVVNTEISGQQLSPTVAVLQNGGFAIAWDDRGTGDTDGSAIRARIFNAPGGDACPPILVHDETPGVQVGPDPNDQNDVAASDLPVGILALFDTVANESDAIGFARAGDGVMPAIIDANYGADGPATSGGLSYALSIPGANGTVNSGLSTTDGSEIYLSLEDGLVVGRVDQGNDSGFALASDPVAIAIAIDAATGELFTAQYLSLLQPDPAQADEAVTLAHDSVLVNVTATDGDNDTAVANPVPIGDLIAYQDNAPPVTADVSVATDENSAVSGTVADNTTDPDNAATDLTYSMVGAVPTGLSFNGMDGSFNFDPGGNFEALGAGDSTQVSFQYQANDGADDSNISTVTITINGVNDAPVAVADSNTGPAVVEAGVVVGGNTPFVGNDAASGNVLTNDTDVDDGDQANLSVSEVDGSAANVGAAVAGTYGSLTLDALGNWTYALDNSDPDTNALAQGESAPEGFNYAVADGNGGFDTTTLTIDIAGTNDQPVISGGDTSGAVTEDTVSEATGQLDVVDPDHGAQQFWTVVGGTPAEAADYHFLADSFSVTKANGTITVLQDDFSDGNPPAAAPDSGTGEYAGTIGNFGEAGDKLLLESNDGIVLVGPGAPYPFIGQTAVVKSNVDANTTGVGLKVGTQFAIAGVFDLIAPDSPREAYGIRALDRLLNPVVNADNTITPAQVGDDTYELVVRETPAGQDVVSLRHLDFEADLTTNLQDFALNTSLGATQIRLILNHAPNSPDLHASFEYLDSLGTVIGSQNFGAVAPVFAADSVDTQTWIRAGIAAYAPQFTDSILDGSYGTLNIGQSGTWNYVLNNALPSTQSLSAGQHDTDNFTVQVADEYGAFDTIPIAIDVTGSNDAPVFQPPFPVSPVLTEDSAVTLATSGIINFTDVDLADTHDVSANSALGGLLGWAAARRSANPDGQCAYDQSVRFSYRRRSRRIPVGLQPRRQRGAVPR